MNLFQDPEAYEFSDAHREEFGERFYPLPCRLAEDGSLRQAWRRTETSRGGGSVTSLLPVLALHAFPERRQDDAARDWIDAPAKSEGWTTWTYLSRRRMARLAGLTKDTVGRALAYLTQLGLLEVYTPRKCSGQGPRKSYYRLATSLFAQKGNDEPFAQIGGLMIYGGVWAMLPLNSARHVYLVASALDRGKELTMAALERFSGLSHRTCHEAIGVLTTSAGSKGPDGLLRKSDFRPNDSVRNEYWQPAILNDPGEMRRIQRTHWPQVLERLVREKRQAFDRKLRARRREARSQRLALIP